MFEEKQEVVTDEQLDAAQALVSSAGKKSRGIKQGMWGGVATNFTKKQKGSKRAPRRNTMRGPAYAHRKKQRK